MSAGLKAHLCIVGGVVAITIVITILGLVAEAFPMFFPLLFLLGFLAGVTWLVSMCYKEVHSMIKELFK